MIRRRRLPLLLSLGLILCLCLCLGHSPLIAAGTAAPVAPASTQAAAAPPSQGWMGQVQQDIASQEYEITWQSQPSLATVGASWHAPNRAHGFRTYFATDGIHVVPREPQDQPWEWGLSLVAYGQGTSRWPVPGATLSPTGKRIAYGRGGIEEWYVNDTRGLEQGFDLHAAPAELAAWSGVAATSDRLALPGAGKANFERNQEDLVFLDLQLNGNLRPVVAADGQAIDFMAPGGTRVLRYAKLQVTDATGRQLKAWMEGVLDETVRGVRIVVNAADAVYPITVDPLATSPAWTAESDQASAEFGFSVATAGDVNGDGYTDVIVGAPYYDNGEDNEGRAYVYLGSAAGLSANPAWTAESDQAGAWFGYSVATAGDVNGDGYADVIVGAIRYDNGESNEGRACVYLGSATGLSASPAWTGESDQIDAQFGRSVATAGDIDGDSYADVIIGAPAYDNGFGGVFVYLGSAAGLSATPAWTGADHPLGLFGSSVSTAGDVNGDGYADVIIGAELYSNGDGAEGGAFLYLGSDTGLSSSPAWAAESDQASAHFGFSVATAGDVNGDGHADVIVGAYRYDNGEDNEGRAYVYLGSAAGLSANPAWTAESDWASAWFGYSVATAGDVNGDGYADVIVGAYGFSNGEFAEGRAFVYLGSAAGLSGGAAWTTESNQAGAGFGHSVGTAGDVNGDGYADIIVGAEKFHNGQTDEGRAFVYLGSAAGPSASAAWTGERNQASAHLGWSVATAGDVNGDGYADVIVGADDFDSGQTDEGRAFVYLGSATGLAGGPTWAAESNQAGAGFGHSVGTAGDVNGDGYADVIVGADAYDNSKSDEGRAYVYLGSATGLSPTAAWTAESNQTNAWFGRSVATAGDVNSDGYADIIIGADAYDNGETDEGRAFVFLGSAAGLSATAAWTAESNQANAFFGFSVTTAGDVNSDGYADVIVGAHGHDNGETDEGRAFVYLGSAAGLSATAWTAESDQIGAQFGYSVATAGDVNGDGYADVIIGANHANNGENYEGRAFLYLGSAAGLAGGPNAGPLDAAWTAESDQAFAYFGAAVATAGDVNGDGYADAVVGAWAYDNGESDEGGAFLYLGSPAGLTTGPAWTAESDQDVAWLGTSVGTAGDVNGDGYADVIAGAPHYDNGETDEGAALVYYGNAGAGLSVKPQQRRGDDLAHISPGLRAPSPDFRITGLGRTPFGRGRVKLEWEVKPLRTGFDGTGTEQSAAWMDTGTAGVALNEFVTQQAAGGLHWRARLLYDPVTSPFAGASRWFTVPWNGWNETDLTMGAFVGGVVWEDRDGDGIRDGSEPAIGGIAIDLLDGVGTLVNATVTASDGSYRMAVPGIIPVKVKVQVPAGYRATTPDQGIDDLVDSDISPVTDETPLIGPAFSGLDPVRWSAGLREIAACFAPDEPIYIYNVRLSTDGNDFAILDFGDFNQPSDVTGYNVYRSSDAGLDPALWPLLADDIVDGLPDTGNQWVDQTNDTSPSGVWYYEVTAYNSICDAEGPR